MLIAAILFVGLFFLASGEYARRHGITPESELVVATGPADWFSVAPTTSRYGHGYLVFNLNGHEIEYESTQYGYTKLIAALRDHTPLTAGVSTKRESLFYWGGRAYLYSLSIGPDVLQTYERTAAENKSSPAILYFIGAALTSLAAWGLHACFKNRNVVEFL